MKAKSFLAEIDHALVVAAIAKVEMKTSGEIRVWVSDWSRPDALAAAKARFLKINMHHTRHRNAVLIFVAPRSRTFAVVGDVGINAKAGEEFWLEVRDVMKAHLQENRYTAAILHAVETAGAHLAEHFPPDADGGGRNELPNEILGD
jgi:uncharacterized membrane protein